MESVFFCRKLAFILQRVPHWATRDANNNYIIVNDNPKSNKRSNEDFLISDEELQLIKNNYEEIRFNLPCNKFKKLHKYKDGDEKCKCFETNYTNYMLMSSVKFKLNLRKKQRHRFKKT